VPGYVSKVGSSTALFSATIHPESILFSSILRKIYYITEQLTFIEPERDIMEAVAAVASIVAIVQIAESIINTCKAYIRDVKDAPSDLRTILIEVGSVKCVLEALELSISSEDENQEESRLLRKLGGGGGPLEGCMEALGALEKLFPSQPQPPPRGKRQRIALSLATLAWHFHREKAKRLLEDISTHKATISLTLAAESR
jgi:hypothetical protein